MDSMIDVGLPNPGALYLFRPKVWGFCAVARFLLGRKPIALNKTRVLGAWGRVASLTASRRAAWGMVR